MKKLSEIRDELAHKCTAKYYEIAEDEDMKGRMIDPVFSGFCNGFDAASAIWREKLAMAVKTLEDAERYSLNHVNVVNELKQFLEGADEQR